MTDIPIISTLCIREKIRYLSVLLVYIKRYAFFKLKIDKHHLHWDLYFQFPHQFQFSFNVFTKEKWTPINNLSSWHYEERKIKKVYIFFHNNLRREDKFLKLTFDFILLTLNLLIMTVMHVYFKQNNIYPTVLQWVPLMVSSARTTGTLQGTST